MKRASCAHRLWLVALPSLLLSLVAAPWVARDLGAQGHRGHDGQGQPGVGGAPPAPGASRPPRPITMEALHRAGGVPRGWRFTLPAGDAARGRQVFLDLECYKCHAIRGENFPSATIDQKNVGPELTGIGAHHPAEYFAESVLAPNAVILDGKGYTGPDGLSTMPGFADSLTVTQLLDLVAYLKSLAGDGMAAQHAVGVERVTVAGDYRVRLVYVAHGAHDHGGHGDAAARPGQLMAFITDKDSGEAVPYLTVSATVRSASQPARTVKLAPRFGERGFHYGARTTLPERTRRISVSVGPTAMELVAPLKGRFGRPVTALLEWEPARR